MWRIRSATSPYPMILQACGAFCFARVFTDEFNNFMKLGLIFLDNLFLFLQILILCMLEQPQQNSLGLKWISGGFASVI